jgi:hypothetical protein
VPAVRLETAGGTAEDFPANLASAHWTVLVFYSGDCPCFKAHEARLVSLRERYTPRGVRFLLVNSESDASLAQAVAASGDQPLPMPLLIDPDGVLAHGLGAEYATYSVLLDPSGAVLFRGGLDSDKSHLHDEATFYLRDALDDLLAGRRPRRIEAKALGCPLQLR